MSKSDLERSLLFFLKVEGLPTPETEVRFAPPRKWRADFLWEEQKVIAEVAGGTWTGGGHVRGKQYESDCEKAAAAQLLGYRYFTFTTDQVNDGRAIETLKKVLG